MMGSDQHFCLRWNNHQNTLVSVFENLLVNERLIDVTLTAEGQMIGAHKVVLSACSPYFEEIFTRCGDKHPVIFLKDIRFSELKALMDYMYKGEVNVSQDQLNILIKAAESLNIKGLADNDRKDETEHKNHSPKLLEQNNGDNSENYRSSHSFDAKDNNLPWPVKRRKKARNRSGESRPSSEPDSDSHDIGGSCALDSNAPSVVIPNIPATITAVHSTPKSSDFQDDGSTKHESSPIACASKVDLNIKEECLDILEVPGDNDIEASDSIRSCDQNEAGPSSQSDSQGLTRYPEVNTSTEDKFDTTETSQGHMTFYDINQRATITCDQCGKPFRDKPTLQRHRKFSCGVDPQFECPVCSRRLTRRDKLVRHIKTIHKMDILEHGHKMEKKFY